LGFQVRELLKRSAILLLLEHQLLRLPLPAEALAEAYEQVHPDGRSEPAGDDAGPTVGAAASVDADGGAEIRGKKTETQKQQTRTNK
jgi:hypothetical protein